MMHRLGAMTARAATIRLYVTLLSVLTTILALVAAVVRLVVTLVGAATALVDARTPACPRRDAPATRDTTSRLAPALRLVTARSSSPTPPAGPMPPTAAERLRSGLLGLGFRAHDVARFVASVGARVEQESLGVLLKEGVAALGRVGMTG